MSNQNKLSSKIGYNRYKGLAWILCVLIVIGFSLVDGFDFHPYRDKIEAEYFSEAQDRILEVRCGDIELDFGIANASKDIYIEQISHDFRFGANLYQFDYFNDEELNQKYRDYFSQLFNYATLPFYWSAYEPTMDSYEMESRLHNMTDWVNEFNGSTKGHPIIWQNDDVIPDWYEDLTPYERKTQALDHIEQVLTEYPEIKTWDLVNEMLHVENSWLGDDALTTWETAVEKARSVSPDCEYVINEYNIMGSGDASKDLGTAGKYYDLVENAVSDGFAPDAIGFQFHSIDRWESSKNIIDTLDSFGSFKIPCQITEFIPGSVGYYTGGITDGKISLETQADYAERIYTLLFSHPAVNAITWWDFSHNDKWNAWKYDQGCYMMDGSGNLLSVYEKLNNLIHKTWNSTSSTHLDSIGKINFTGYYGNYSISIDGEEPLYFEIHDNRTVSERPWVTQDIK